MGHVVAGLDLERVVVDGGSWSPGGGPEVVVEDVEDRPVQGPGKSAADLGLLAAAPVDPLVAEVHVLLADGHGEAEQRAVVVTEADALLSPSSTQYRSQQPVMECGDRPIPKPGSTDSVAGDRES